MFGVKNLVLSVGLMLAVAVVGLTGNATGSGQAADASRLAYAGDGSDGADAWDTAPTPSLVQDLRNRYVALRKRAFDACRDATGNADGAGHRRCFQEALERLVEAADAPSLTQYHAYLSRIPRPVN